MSRIIYNTVNKEYNKYKSNENKNYSINIITATYKLLLDIIDDKYDDEFNDFYIKYMVLQKENNPLLKFDNVNDFINNICLNYKINEEKYYTKLNIFLIDIVNINEKLKKEEEEQEKIELLKNKKEIEEENNKQSKTIAKKVEKEVGDKKKKKKPISATVKKLVWNINIGEEIGKSKCMCCNSTDITQMSFNCGHIIAEANGGETIVSNLKPICQNCNSSMGTKNMNDFMKSLK
jgi:hypothetical protein